MVDLELIRKIRGELEQQQLNVIEHIEVPRMKLKDKLFAGYLQLLRDLDKWEKEQDYGKKLTTWGVKTPTNALIGYFREQYIKSRPISFRGRLGLMA